MKTRLLKPKLWAALLIFAFVCLLLWPPIHQVIAVAAVQNSVDYGWVITFGSGTVPAGLPVSVDSAVEDLIGRMFAQTAHYTGAYPESTLRRDIIYHERFRAFFRGPIRGICIDSPGGFRGDLGAALARFPDLRGVYIADLGQSQPSEADWKLLFTRLRALPDLEEVALRGNMITDAALAPLSGHPGIKYLTLNYGNLTDKSIQTFASMPNLRELEFEGVPNGDIEWPGPESEKAIIAALPNVKVEIRKDPPPPDPTPDNASP